MESTSILETSFHLIVFRVQPNVNFDIDSSVTFMSGLLSVIIVDSVMKKV